MHMILLSALVAVAAAAPQNYNDQFNQRSNQPEIRILSQRFDMDPDAGSYVYSYEQDNGQAAEEQGQSYPGPEPETGSLTQQGSFQFVGDDGNTYQVSYVADEGGFQPQGAHLPVPPAQIPEYEQLRIDHPELFWAEQQQYI